MPMGTYFRRVAAETTVAPANYTLAPTNDTILEDDPSVDPTQYWSGEGPSMAAFLIFFFALIICGCFGVYCRPSRQYRVRQLTIAEREVSNKQVRDKAARMALIKNNLVLKKVKIVEDLDHKAKQTDNDVEKPKTCHVIIDKEGLDPLDMARTCPICLCEFEDGDSLCWSNNTNCRHVFHAECGISWLEKSLDCPVCRASYLVEHPHDIEKGDVQTQSTTTANTNRQDNDTP